MKEIKFAGEIRDGKLIIYSRELLNADISKQEDQRVLGSLKSMAKKRTLRQNGLLHFYLHEISDHTGMEMLDLKEILKFKFTQKPAIGSDGHEMFDPETGEIFMMVPSTADLSTIEMANFTEKIREWANSFLGLQLPLPDEQGELKL